MIDAADNLDKAVRHVLVAATVLKARDEGLPIPTACVMISPCTDLTQDGDTWNTNEGVDTVMRGSFMPCFELYADGHDLRNPYLSPVYGDFTKGFPPTILTSGARDKLLSDTVRFHRALRVTGIEAELHVFEAFGHAGFLGTAPEDAPGAGAHRPRLSEGAKCAASCASTSPTEARNRRCRPCARTVQLYR